MSSVQRLRNAEKALALHGIITSSVERMGQDMNAVIAFLGGRAHDLPIDVAEGLCALKEVFDADPDASTVAVAYEASSDVEDVERAALLAWIEAADRARVPLLTWGPWSPSVDTSDWEDGVDVGGVVAHYRWYAIKYRGGVVTAVPLDCDVEDGETP